MADGGGGKVMAIPDGYTAVTPYMRIAGAAKAIELYRKVFGAEEVMRLDDPAGKIGHAEIKIGGAHIMLSDEYPDMGMRGPKSLGGTTMGILVYVDDVDKVAAKAVDAGFKVLQPVSDQFYGDRSGKFEDPFGHEWFIGTHIEDVPPDELARRVAKLYGG